MGFPLRSLLLQTLLECLQLRVSPVVEACLCFFKVTCHVITHLWLTELVLALDVGLLLTGLLWSVSGYPLEPFCPQALPWRPSMRLGPTRSMPGAHIGLDWLSLLRFHFHHSPA